MQVWYLQLYTLILQSRYAYHKILIIRQIIYEKYSVCEHREKHSVVANYSNWFLYEYSQIWSFTRFLFNIYGSLEYLNLNSVNRKIKTIFLLQYYVTKISEGNLLSNFNEKQKKFQVFLKTIKDIIIR